MTGVLHTNSAYFSAGGNWSVTKDFSMMDIMSSFNEAYNYAKERELEFYRTIFPNDNIQTYQQFIIKLRTLFRDAKGDGMRIQGLSNSNLRQIVPNQSMKAQVQYQVIITGNLCEKIPIELIAPKNGSVEGGPIYLTLDSKSISTIKQVLKDEFKRNFDPESSDMRNLKNLFRDIVEKKTVEQLSTNFIVTKAPNSTKEIVIPGELEGFLFANNLDKKQRQAYLNGDYGTGLQKQFEQEMRNALAKVKTFIYQQLQVSNGTQYENGGNILEKAVDKAWNDIIENRVTGSPDFFFEKDNLFKSVLGKGGEFQLAVIDNYIQMVTATNGIKIGHIIGDIVKDNRQEPRSDYQLVLELGGDIGNTIIGIQSKNISHSSKQKVDINTDLGLVAPNLDSGLVDTIVNSYFNTDILVDIAGLVSGSMTTYLTEYLEAYFWKAMNLNIGPNLDPYHTNTFYWVSGSDLVPSSTIIQTLNQDFTISPEFNVVKASWPALSDEEFLEEDDDGDPIFTQYWLRYGKTWYFMDYGDEVYQQLMENTRIHTTFNMSSILNINGINNFNFLNGLLK